MLVEWQSKEDSSSQAKLLGMTVRGAANLPTAKPMRITICTVIRWTKLGVLFFEKLH